MLPDSQSVPTGKRRGTWEEPKLLADFRGIEVRENCSELPLTFTFTEPKARVEIVLYLCINILHF